MGSSFMTSHCFVVVTLFLLYVTATYGQLSQNFYSENCPVLERIVQTEVSGALSAEKRMGASLLRLFFHDCFVQGCDGSVLLNDAPDSERDADANANSLRGFDVIDAIKTQVEANCPGVVSCADILALATREAVVELGGPSWTLLLGRRDSTTSSKKMAEDNLPSPSSSLDELVAAFANKGFTPTELVALSGAHTIGMAKCGFADEGQVVRPECKLDSLATTALDLQTPEVFDNTYYDDLMRNQGLLHSDNVLITDTTLNSLVRTYNSDPALFNADFSAAMNKLSELGLLTGDEGQIRLNCNKVNVN
ncbi:hypothetical protein PR202_gb06702 [Eleusine coracana subsp. coracana]|uniref:Peroxidase n=1 Tax=Eleusine coracana subsp. coracana TaxID=191504 RepID=A0AAV5E7T4_ELECO|nr:hypothetical protein QOZ80_2BG0161110 [Eleusine coracana subsp. coracana]GJN19424.1 hypothetical protein PR202_gb06702 [Eleusine coracana subsp. coracana]